MDQFLQQMVNGISLGSIYALIALGYTMVYGIIKLINFAHGDVYMIGAYVGFAATTYAQLGFFAAMVISMVSCALLGIIIERIAYKPLRTSTRIAVLITAIGVSLLLEYVMMFFVGAEVKSYPQLLSQKVFNFGAVQINMQQIYIIATAVALMVLLQYIVHRTKTGKAMRAVSIDPDAAQLMGIKVDRTISITFAIGSAFAGAAGVLVGIYYNSINPLMGIMPGLKAFVAAVFGGIGSIPGAMIGGLSIGVLETLVSGYGNSMYRDAAVFAFLIIILILKPTGLLGKNTREKV
ncbi:MAG: branched-chain amino acid ABC transporter permease [Eubacteriales bacterium]|nr:branched-chain amino acid ABC transporter permease [Eubacteriales bacterium]MDD3349667.1 branched-chain amino acid ABC transporter permease [Eubacteriales bacterium]